MKLILSLTALLLAPLTALHAAETPPERDARMQWWREARFGMFVHWGLYSGLAGTWNGKPISTKSGMEWIQNKVNGESIYGTTANPITKPAWGRATQRGKVVYLHVFHWPKDGKLTGPLKGQVKEARLLSSGQPVQVDSQGNDMLLHLPGVPPDPVASDIRVELN